MVRHTLDPGKIGCKSSVLSTETICDWYTDSLAACALPIKNVLCFYFPRAWKHQDEVRLAVMTAG